MLDKIINAIQKECLINSNQILVSIYVDETDIYTYFAFGLTDNKPAFVKIKTRKNQLLDTAIQNLKSVGDIVYERCWLRYDLLVDNTQIYDIVEATSVLYNNQKIEIDFNCGNSHHYTVAYIIIELSRYSPTNVTCDIASQNIQRIYDILELVHCDLTCDGLANPIIFSFGPLKKDDNSLTILNKALRTFDNNSHMHIQSGACTIYATIEVNGSRISYNRDERFTESKGMVLEIM